MKKKTIIQYYSMDVYLHAAVGKTIFNNCIHCLKNTTADRLMFIKVSNSKNIQTKKPLKSEINVNLIKQTLKEHAIDSFTETF